jgi:CHAD domain-containing protein
MPEGVQSVNRSHAYRLKRKEGTGEGLARIATGRAEKALERLEDLGPGDPELAIAVHGVRKDMKKLRTILRLLRDELGESRYEEENRRYREAAGALSATRDAEVKLETLAALQESSDDLPASAFAWRQMLERDRDRAADGIGRKVVGTAVELIEAGRKGIDRWQLRDESWDLLDRGLLRTYRRGRKAMRRASEEPSEEDLHRWRKRVKDLWYEVLLLRSAWPGLLDPTAEQAHQLADLLGEHHDLAVLREDLAERRLGSEPTEALRSAISRRQDQLEADAFDLGRRLYAERPKAFRRRVRRYWEAWHE